MLLWFRNDLRVIDNPALDYAIKCGAKHAVFFISKKQWQQHKWSKIKIDFVLRHARLLQAQLTTYNIKLSLIDADDFNAQINYLVNNHKNDQLIVSKELELNEIKRDQALVELGFDMVQFESDVIVSKGRLLNQSGQTFKVFTPFKRAWLKCVNSEGFDFILPQPNVKKAVYSYTEPQSASSKWPLVTEIIQDVIPLFLQQKIHHYAEQRDIPSIKGTSGLSPYLAIGAISPRYLLRLLISNFPDILSEQPASSFTWLNELIWREFYRHLLFHYPNLIKGEDFSEKYKRLVWPNDETSFIAWQEGKTGYPIVDAAMRQLNQTGWMHNRLRMIVASFLTKHLLIDWRLGEAYFASKLIDYDFSANNGGWQWSAGTGCDAQPYFRIFNPITQSKKFDPQGDFIRKYLPELTNVPDKYIHFPHEYLNTTPNHRYWPAIVEHKFARERALSFYKQGLA